MIFDVPRITNALKESATAHTSSVVYNTDDDVFEYFDGDNWVVLGSGSSEYTNEATGFPVGADGEVDRTSSVLSFTNNSRIFSIAPASTTFTFLVKDKIFVKNSAQTITISDTEGLHYIYFDATGNLQSTTSFSLDLIYKYAYVAVIYWNAEDNVAIYFGDERHGCTMDAHTHARIHQRDGAIFISGMALSGFAADGDGSSDSHAQFAIGSGSLRDEDILHARTSVSSTAAVPVLYRVGTNWRSTTTATFKTLSAPSGRLYYNQLVGGNYQLTQVANNKFSLYHIVATNDKDNPYFSIMGTEEYLTKPAAREGALAEIKTLSGLPFVEFVVVASIIFETSDSYTNAVKARVLTTDAGGNYIDWRFSGPGLNPTTANATTHNNLGGIQGGGTGNYYHSDQPINSDSSPTFANVTVSGNLTVNGTTTNINSTNLVVEDKNIVLGDVATPTDVTAAGGGITLKGASDKTITWMTNEWWESSEHLNLVSTKTYKINGTTVLSSSQVLGKTLPTGDVVGTSDTQTLTNKTINGNDNTITNVPVKQVINGLTTVNLNNTNTTIDLSTYTTTGLRLQAPALITFSGGTAGTWYTIVVESDSTGYSFSSEVRFPLDNTQPNVSVDGKVDVYSLYCISATKYIATFAFQYTSVF